MWAAVFIAVVAVLLVVEHLTRPDDGDGTKWWRKPPT